MALHGFDTLQKPDDILRVNSSCAEFDKQLFDRIFPDEVENMLGVDLDKLDVTPPPAPKLETPTPAPVVTVSFPLTLVDMQYSSHGACVWTQTLHTLHGMTSLSQIHATM